MKYLKNFFRILIISVACIIVAASAGCKVQPERQDKNFVISYGGYEESLYAVWQDTAPQNAKAYYKEKSAGENGWIQIDAPLIRKTTDGQARVDALGLKAGDYNIKIVTSGGETAKLSKVVTVSDYDRSGYAHFKRRSEEAAYSGVGAYKDDGTLKDNTLIVYVTDENKNDIRNSVYFNGEKINIENWIPYADCNGIGYFLNGNNSILRNLMYANNSFTVDAVSVRFIGKVNAEYVNSGDPDACKKSLINGLTEYGSDNGRMAQIINCKNVTLEGVGTDAEIHGWGFTFIAKDIIKDAAYRPEGSSFEVRNLIFRNYPEDAIGMEGRSFISNESLDCPVERCWIHNNVFYKGHCENPVENDKYAGDGAVDFKRGRYYTLSYNYFGQTQKTCLIGGNSNDLQYNITMHHNWWNNCGARKPLLRRANLHYYNNYISENYNSSHIISFRAYSYTLMEANYFEKCKAVAVNGNETEPDGINAVKDYNNVYDRVKGYNFSVLVTSRTEKVENMCQYAYGGIDYSSFDTDPDLFYYDAEKQVSDCLLDTAAQAKTNVMRYAGVHGFGSRNS